MTSLTLADSVVSIENAFTFCDYLTIYVEAEEGEHWSNDWNNEGRPVVWVCVISADKSYVVSVNQDYLDVQNPVRKDYVFGGWYTQADFSDTKYDTLAEAPIGDLYAKWIET